MKDKLISIILPVYNSQDYIQNTIESILSQTYKKFEIIIVNDGSTDDSGLICEKIAKKNNCIRYFSINNMGVSNARNIALKEAKGEYVTFIDSDDLYEREYLELLVTNIEKYNADLITCAYKTLSNNPKIINYSENYLDCKFKDYIEKLQPNLLFNQLWNKMYKLDIIKENNLLFDNNLDLGEDYKFNLEYIKFIDKLIYINVPLYQYRITNTGLGFKYRPNSSEIKLALLKILENIYNEKNYNLSYIYKNYLIQFLSSFSNIVDTRNKDKKQVKLNKIKELINSSEYRNKLKEIENNSSLKIKIICKIMSINNKYIIYTIAKLANIYDKNKKKKKYF